MFMPGFGIAGGTGTALVIVGIILAADTFMEALILSLVLFALLALVILLAIHSAKRGKLSKKLVLRSAATREEGFSAADASPELVGKEGIALTALRPAGIGEFDGERLDVVSEGGFIQAGVKIKIVFSQGMRIVVKPVD
jgi:membrane-bound ClpP family serine protease